MTIARYVVSNTPEEWGDGSMYNHYDEARAAAIESSGCVTEIEYEYSDSSLVDDFRNEESDDSEEEE